MAITLDTVRQHLRIDDGDDDAVMTIYTNAAIDAAERYTGRPIRAGTASEVVTQPMGSVFKLKGEPTGPVTAVVDVGGRQMRYPAVASGGYARVPVTLECGVDSVEFQYPVGGNGECEADVLAASDPMTELGILQFIAHAWTNRGDAPNDWAVNSGAVRLWQSKRSAFF